MKNIWHSGEPRRYIVLLGAEARKSPIAVIYDAIQGERGLFERKQRSHNHNHNHIQICFDAQTRESIAVIAYVVHFDSHATVRFRATRGVKNFCKGVARPGFASRFGTGIWTHNDGFPHTTSSLPSSAQHVFRNDYLLI